MGLARRQFLQLAAGAAALPAVSGIARAKTYPTRPVRLVVPYAAGGPSDIAARLIGQSLAERLGQQIIIDNRPGAGSNIGTEVVVTLPPERVMSALAPIAEGAPPIQPHAEMSSVSSSPEVSSNRAKRALFGAGV